jgi:hypothetical protein
MHLACTRHRLGFPHSDNPVYQGLAKHTVTSKLPVGYLIIGRRDSNENECAKNILYDHCVWNEFN